jgi:uncharacterized membrane protein
MRTSPTVLLLAAGLSLCIGTAGRAAPIVYNLGVLPGGTESVATGVTPDGWTVAGAGDKPSVFRSTFRWTLSGGLQDLGYPASLPWASGGKISSNGQALAGPAANRLFRWTQSGGMQNLGVFGISTIGLGTGISGDGNTVVGWCNDNGFGGMAAVYWTPTSGGLQLLPALPGGLTVGNNALGISPDGSIIVGTSGWTGSGVRAVRWLNGGTVVQNLGVLPGGLSSWAEDVSTDNSAVAGYSHWSGSGTRAIRWTAAGGMVNLGIPAGGLASQGSAINGDGQAIVGFYTVASNVKRALLWNTTIGTVDLTNYLNGIGANLSGYTLTTATDINQDGSAIVATGSQFVGGPQRAFLIRNIPCPSGPRIIDDPIGRTACPGSVAPVTLTVVAEAPGGGQVNLEYQWHIEFPPDSGQMVPISDGPYVDTLSGLTFEVAGANTPNLNISNMRPAPGGLPVRDPRFGGGVTNPCATVISNTAVIHLIEPCNLADIAPVGGMGTTDECADEQLTVDDVIVFFNTFSDSIGCPGAGTLGACNVADVCGIGGPPELPDGQLTVDDVIAFVNAFSDGC